MDIHTYIHGQFDMHVTCTAMEEEGTSTCAANFTTATEKTLSMYQSLNHC